MLDVFLNVILPTFLVAAIAAAFQRWRKVSIAPLNQVMLYILAPALIFTSLVQQEMPASVSGRIVAAMLLATAFVLVASTIISRWLRHDRAMRSAFMLSTGFPNSGNMALPILLLAFGQPGLTVGIIVFVTQAITGQSLGIFIAARSQMSGLAPLRQVFRLPAIYAISAALLVRLLGIDLPFTISRPVEMLSQAAIPAMLVVLGLQLGTGFGLDSPPSLVAALTVRLLLSAPLAYLATVLVGLSGLSQSVVIIVSAMPVAVFTTILAAEFKAGPKFVTSVVIASTFLSVFTLTVIISAVKAFIGV
ncbi:MAG: AEC family transporter [Chloroflexi bacterium]|nr:AEC family transporter [Chloroflexota bacterium]